MRRMMNNANYQTRISELWNQIPPDDTVIGLPSPIEIFSKYIPDYIFEQMRNITILYARQKDIPRFSAPYIIR